MLSSGVEESPTVNVDQEIQQIEAEHLRDLENGALREKLRQLYRRSGRATPQSLARRSVDIDQLHSALESGGRVSGLDNLLKQGLRPANAWRYLNELLLDTDYPEQGQGTICQIYAIGSFSLAAFNLLEFDRRYYSELMEKNEISALLVERFHRTRSWLLLRAFGEDPKRVRSQELNPARICVETLEAVVSGQELENFNLAIRLGFKIYFFEGES